MEEVQWGEGCQKLVSENIRSDNTLGSCVILFHENHCFLVGFPFVIL